VLLYRVGWTKIINFIGVLFHDCIVYIYIYIYIYISTNIIQIQDKLIINYTIQTKYQNIMKVKYFNTNILNIKLGQCYQS